MGRPILIFRNSAWAFMQEDVELLRDSLPAAHELLKEKLHRTATTIDPATIDPFEYQGLLDAIHAIRKSGVNLSDDLKSFQKELEAEVGGRL